MQLTKRQKEVAKQAYKKCGTSREIAKDLYIEESTVTSHLTAIYYALNIRNKTDLIAYIIENPDVIREPETRIFQYKREPTRVKLRRLKAALLIADLRDKCKDKEVAEELNNAIASLALSLR